MACKYGESLGCAECNYVRFILCPRFKEARVRACAQELGSFKYVGGASADLTGDVYYGRFPQTGIKDVRALYRKKEYEGLSARLKSMALRTALHRYSGVPVMYMSMDSIVEVCFAYGRGVYEFVRGVYFLEVWECVMEQQKAVSFLNSIISKITSNGGCVFLLSSWVLPVLGLNWCCVSLSAPKRGVRSSRAVVSGGSSNVAGSYMQEEGVL